MLTRVDVVTSQAQSLELHFDDDSNGYFVKKIEGLDPVKANIVSSTFAQLDGSQPQASRRENRNITINLGLEPNYAVNSVQQLRNGLYNYFMPESFVTLRFYIDDEHFVNISGQVESLESDLFTSEPEATISIICFDPDFSAIGPLLYTGFTVEDQTDQTIAYSGTVNTGFVLKLWIDRPVTELMIYNRPRGGSFQWFELVGDLVAGDILEISTVPGSKHAILNRGGVDRSILYSVSPSSAWLSLYPGENDFRVVMGGAPLPFTIEYLAKYGGL